jgi:hypothetical protein
LIVLFLLFILSLFIYKNSFYFVFSLLITTLTLFRVLAVYNSLNYLTIFMLVIVYVGAIIVLIGYICAVSPNLSLEPDYTLLLPLFIAFTLFYFINFFPIFNLDRVFSSLVDYYYSLQGLFTFLTLVFILFVTLLIVTCPYSVFGGPFRSISLS